MLLVAHDLIRAFQVNREWRDVSRDAAVWQRLVPCDSKRHGPKRERCEPLWEYHRRCYSRVDSVKKRQFPHCTAIGTLEVDALLSPYMMFPVVTVLFAGRIARSV